MSSGTASYGTGTNILVALGTISELSLLIELARGDAIASDDSTEAVMNESRRMMCVIGAAGVQGRMLCEGEETNLYKPDSCCPESLLTRGGYEGLFYLLSSHRLFVTAITCGRKKFG